MKPPEKSETQSAAPKPEETFVNEGPGANATQASVGNNRKVLIVDDNPVVLKAFETKLKASGFKVVTAEHSSAAIPTARAEKPDLIVLDINFPPDEGFSTVQWNGLNVLQWFKRFQEVAEIPIVVISGDDPSKHKDKVLAAGAAAYFQKPLVFKDFISTLLPILAGERAVNLNPEI